MFVLIELGDGWETKQREMLPLGYLKPEIVKFKESPPSPNASKSSHTISNLHTFMMEVYDESLQCLHIVKWINFDHMTHDTDSIYKNIYLILFFL